MKNLTNILKKAEKALRKKKYKEAIKNLKLYLEINPRSVNKWSNLAFSHNKMGEYDKAIDSCILGLEAEPNNKDALNNLFFAYDQKGDFDKALEVLQNYVQFHSVIIEQPFNVHENIILYSNNKFIIKYDKKFLKNQRDQSYSEFENKYDSLIDKILPSIDPNNIIPLNFLSFFKFSNIIKSEKEIDVLELMLESFPDKSRVLNKLGLVHLKQQNYNKSIEMFNQSLKINPEVIDTWIFLGDVYFQMRQFNKALDAFKHALKIDPKTREAWMNIGHSYIKLGEFNNAIDTLKKALDIYPSAKRTLEFLTELSPNIEKSNVKIVYKLESTKYIWYYLAQAYYKVQKYDKALEACNQSLKINRNFDKALKFKEKILSTKK